MSHHSQRQWLSPSWWGPQLVWNNIMSLWAALLLVVNHIWQAGPRFPMVFLQTDQSADSVCRHMWQSQMLPSLSLYYLMAFLCSAGSSLNMKRQIRNENVVTDYTQANDSQNMQNLCWHEDKVAETNNRYLTSGIWWRLFIFHVIWLWNVNSPVMPKRCALCVALLYDSYKHPVYVTTFSITDIKICPSYLMFE